MISNKWLSSRSFKRAISKLKAPWVSEVHTGVDRHQETNIDRRDKHRPMESSEHRLTHPVQHQSTPFMEYVASCKTVRIMTHEDFAARHPHPPQPYHVTTEDINRQQQPSADRHQTLGNDRQDSSSFDQHLPFTYWVELPSIDESDWMYSEIHLNL